MKLWELVESLDSTTQILGTGYFNRVLGVTEFFGFATGVLSTQYRVIECLISYLGSLSLGVNSYL